MTLFCSEKIICITKMNNVKTCWYFFYLNGLDLFTTKNNSASHKKVSKNKNSCGLVMLSEEIKLLEFN